MALVTDPVSAVANAVETLGGAFINRMWPDPVAQASERSAAQLAMLQAQNDQIVKQTTAGLSAIIAEAQSADPWTSRARPSFMYVIYIMILAALPMSIVFAFKPAEAVAVTNGLKLWLSAIPDSLYTLFGVGYLGYTGARSVEKVKGAS